MTRDALIRYLRRDARKLGLELRIEKAEGKGSHYRCYLGTRVTTVQSGELTPMMVRRIRSQLGLDG